MARTKLTESRHTKRAEGKTQTSISMREDLLNLARLAAEKEGRSFSNWIEQLLRDRFAGRVSETPAPAAKKAAAPAKPAAKPAVKAAAPAKNAPAPAKAAKATKAAKKAAAPAKKARR